MPAKPPAKPLIEITNEVFYAGRKEAFAYLLSLGIINYSSWDDVYFVEKDGILHILKYQ
jgi:hypothetical protein